MPNLFCLQRMGCSPTQQHSLHIGSLFIKSHTITKVGRVLTMVQGLKECNQGGTCYYNFDQSDCTVARRI